jgi:mitochondrial fusion and transport protein UGO1
LIGIIQAKLTTSTRLQVCRNFTVGLRHSFSLLLHGSGSSVDAAQYIERMQEPRLELNPLRPYYIPPSIGETAGATVGSNATSNVKPPTSFSNPASTSFSFPDIDYSDYIPEASPSVTGSVKSLLDQLLWKYSSVLLAQPFEVAKMILQVRVAQEDDLDDLPVRLGEESPRQQHDGSFKSDGEDSDDDEPNFFTSNRPFDQSPLTPPRGRRGRPSLPQSRTASYKQPDSATPTPSADSRQLRLKNSHSLLDALSALSTSSGALSMWRGTNSTFIYNILARTLETFFRSFFAALFGIAEPDGLISFSTSAVPDTSILNSTSPTATVLISTAAATLAALVLSPVDAARTRLILTPSSDEPRTLLGTTQTLSPSYLIPAHLLPITFLTSTIPTFISTSTPLFLRSYLRIDPNMNPTSWSLASFLSSALDLSIKFPLETVLRRAQISTWTAPRSSLPSSSSKRKAITTIVPVPQSYRGILPTIWGIVREEGYSESAKDKTAALMGKAPRRKRKGQGFEGLYRGWRVGLWGLVGIWGTGFVGGLQGGVETAEPSVHGGKF